jgi:predicted nucleic acid-binding Zn ribbon protein
MSDDTPTQRLPQTGENPAGGAPTEQFATAEVQEDLQEEKQKSRGLLIGLIVAGVLLVVAIIVLLVFLFGGKAQPEPQTSGTATPAPSTTSTPEASGTPTPEPTQDAPAAPTPVVDSFSTGTGTVWCGTPDDPEPDIDLDISWSTSNGNRVYFGVDTNDASAAPFFDNLPLSGNSGSNFPSGYSPFQFTCGAETHRYTLTVVDAQNHKDSKTVTVKDLAYAQNNS